MWKRLTAQIWSSSSLMCSHRWFPPFLSYFFSPKIKISRKQGKINSYLYFSSLLLNLSGTYFLKMTYYLSSLFELLAHTRQQRKNRIFLIILFWKWEQFILSWKNKSKFREIRFLFSEKRCNWLLDISRQKHSSIGSCHVVDIWFYNPIKVMVQSLFDCPNCYRTFTCNDFCKLKQILQ